jgi:hypothetical protein
MRKALCVAAILATSLAGVATAAVPAKYRYTGVVGPIAQPAGHWIVVGDGIKFYFADHNAPTTGTQYRVCVAKVHQCWNRRTRPNSYTDTFSIGDFALPQYGAMIARWYVGGRVVAVWNFYYEPEGA